MSTSNRIDIEVEDKGIRDLLERIQRQGSNLRPAMNAMATEMHSITQHAFTHHTDPMTGRPWDDLAPSTKAQRKREGTWPGKILQISPAGLSASIQTNVGDDFAEIGTNKPYAATHQFGFDGTVSVLSHPRTITQVFGKRLASPSTHTVRAHQRQTHIPVRPFLGLSPDHKEDIKNLLLMHILPD